MNLYAESSAVLAWLLGEDAGLAVREVLRRAELVVRCGKMSQSHSEGVHPYEQLRRCTPGGK